MKEKDLDGILNRPVFSNGPHKEALRDKLFKGKMELDPDELSMVVGGVAESPPLWEDWDAFSKGNTRRVLLSDPDPPEGFGGNPFPKKS